MKENKYDDRIFFEQYSKMPRSVEGLSAAGEWHALQNLLPDFSGKRVLDLGCGFGWHCGHAAAHGASRVVGTDISENMLAQARERNPSPVIEYLKVPMEDVDFPSGSFDVVISSLAIHYVSSYNELCGKVNRLLSDDGVFIFSVEHPVFTAEGKQGWYRDEKGNTLHWPVDNYFREGSRNAVFLGETVIKYHRTLTTYINGLLGNGFAITGLVEPQPPEELLHSVPGMEDELRRPMMLLLRGQKLG